MRKRTNRIRIVLSKIKDVRRKEVNSDGFSFFCRPVKKIIAYYILRSLISCAFIAMDFLWEIYIVLKEKKEWKFVRVLWSDFTEIVNNVLWYFHRHNSYNSQISCYFALHKNSCIFDRINDKFYFEPDNRYNN